MLPLATGGDGVLNYDLEPPLPNGLSFDKTTRVISGTPLEDIDDTEYSWTATDEDGDTAELTFTIEVAADLVPVFTETVGAQNYIQYQPIDPLTLPLATGGDGTLTYALTPGPSAGLTFDLATRMLSGMPTEAMVATECIWTATDEDGDTAELTFTIEVAADLVPAFTETVGVQNYIQYQPIDPLMLPLATGGDGVLNYDLEPPLPNGLSFDKTTRVISGTPLEDIDDTEYSWTATDEDGDTAELTFTIEVAADLVPAFTETVGAQNYIQYQPIDPLTLPLATGGDGTLTYALTPGPSAGLTFDLATRMLSGMPTEAMVATECIWTATDEDGDTAELTFTIEVAADLVPAFTETVGVQNYIQYQPIDPLMLPLATGGDGVLNYDLEPPLPNGLSFDKTTRVISGTPLEDIDDTEYSWTATDEDGDTAELTFTIEVAADLVPAFTETVGVQNYIQYQPIDPLTLPLATGGDGVLNYDLEPPLPNGLSFDKTTRVISGTPLEDIDDTEYSWTATDEDGDTAELTFTIEVAADLVPAFTETVGAQNYIQYQPIDPLTLPLATGGDGTLTYALTPGPSAGLTFDLATRMLSGMPTEAMVATECIWTATDEDGDTAELTFTIEVAADLVPAFTETVGVQNYIQYQPIDPLMLPLATGGDGVLNYDLEPPLPNGLSFDKTTRVISGTPLEDIDDTAYSWTATDEDGDTAELTFTIEVAADLVPVFTETVGAQNYIQYQPIDPLTLPLATGGDGVLNYDLEPPLPNGLSFDKTTRVISGTPLEDIDDTKYSWTATDEDGDETTLTFTIEVAADLVPVFTETVGAQNYIQYQPIDPLTLPLATGGDGTLTYALTPGPSAGLTFDLATRMLSGMPTEAMVATECIWTATDEDGDETTLTFTIEVAADLVPAFTETVGAQNYVQYQPIDPLTLPLATGGDGVLNYDLEPPLPNGLSFDKTTRVISGTPLEDIDDTEYSWTATDEDGDTAELTFTIEVAADLVPAFTETVGAQNYIQYQPIDPLTLPLATGGDGVLNYDLEPPLPNGLSFDKTTRVISGTPLEDMDDTKYSWTATDEDGDTAELTFTIEVAADLVPVFTETVGAQNYIQYQPIDPLTLPLATGGDGVLNYDLEPPLPNGLSFDKTTRVISGTPLEDMDDTKYSWTATDEDGDETTLTFTIEVAADLVPAFTETVGAQNYIQYQPIDPLTLPLATGGDGTLTYALTPGPSAGLTFDLATRMLSGMPTEAMAATECIWTATDEDGDETTLTFTIEVAADLVPAFTDTVGAQNYVQYQPIDPLTLPLATGGDGVLNYDLEPPLPNGLSFDKTTRVISGTPLEDIDDTEYSWTATDEDGDETTLTFTIEVAADLVPVFTETVGAQNYIQYQPIDPLTLPLATGGDGTLTYALTPGPSAGLTFDLATRMLSGMPTEAMAATECIWTATDEDGDETTLTFTIEVAADLVPAFTETVGAQNYIQYQPIDPLTLPLATGGDGTLTYALTPGPSAGLTFDLATRMLSGMPTEAMAATECIWTATDEDGDTAMLVFTVEVDADLIPRFTETVGPQRYRAGRAIAPLTLPLATGGDAPLTYSLTPTLPAGLVLDAATRIISGTPTTPMNETAYKWMVTDADGDVAELIFTIAIEVSDRTRLKAINELILPELSRAMRTSTLDALTGRIDQEGTSRAPGIMNSEAALSFVASKVMASEYAIKEGTGSWQEVIGGSSFALPLSHDHADTLNAGRGRGVGALWGASDFRRLSLSGDAPISWDGDLFAAHLGADMRFGNGFIAGLVGSWFEGSVTYTDQGYGEAVDGTHESRMVSAHPYLSWSSPMGSNLWATAGYGRGEVAMDDEKVGHQTSDSDLRTAAAGGRVRLSGGLSSFDLKGEAWMTRLAVDDNGDGIEGVTANTQRLRLAGEAAHTFGFASGASLTPSIELGMRMDAGDGQTGTGVELGGGMRYAAVRLTVEATSRILIAHTGDTKEWSAGLSVRFSPRDDARGLSFQVQPSYGETGSGVAQLWEQGAVGAGLNSFAPTMQMDTEVGYTVPMFAGLLTPYSGFRFSEDGTQGYRFGGRVEIGGLGNVSLEGMRDEASDAANHGVMLRGQLNF